MMTTESETRVANLMSIGMSAEQARAAVAADDSRPRQPAPTETYRAWPPAACRGCHQRPVVSSRGYVDGRIGRDGLCRDCRDERTEG